MALHFTPRKSRAEQVSELEKEWASNPRWRDVKRGYTATDDLWDWRKAIEEGEIDRRSGAVIILDHDGVTEAARYEFFNAWPCKWNVPDFAGDQSGMAIEKIELAVEQVKRS